MNVDQVYAILRNGDEDPRPALQWALDHWDEAADRLLSKLRALAAKLPDDCNSPEYDEADGAALFFLIHLFAEKRDTRAYAPLCDRLARDIGLSAWLGETPQTTLPGVLINLYDGDLEPLRRLIESAGGDEWVRPAAFEAWTYLVRMENAAPEEEARAFLLKLLAEAEPREPDNIWTQWALAVARLGYADLGPDVARLFSKSWIADFELTLQEYHGVLAQARADPAAAFAEAGVEPFGSTIAMLEDDEGANLDDFSIFNDDDDIADAAPGQPHVNEMRDVGRNDPCPCGSGKKYKKCCLAA